MDDNVQCISVSQSNQIIEGVYFSQDTAKLDAALATAQGKIKAAKKNAENNAFKKDGKASKFADLEAVYEVCRSALSEAGIAVTQWPQASDTFGAIRIVTRLAKDGQFIMACLDIPTRDKSAHGVSGAITYGRRVALNAVIGIAADEEDDGNAASGIDANGNKKPDEKPQSNDKPSSKPQGQKKPPIKNHAPGAENKDPFPPDDAERQAAIQELYTLVEELGLTAQKSKELIEMALGRSVKSTNLTLVEAKAVLAFIKDMPA